MPWKLRSEIWVFGSFRLFFKTFQTFEKFCFWGIHNSLPSFWAKLDYSWIKIDHTADSLLKLQITIGASYKCQTVATPYSGTALKLVSRLLGKGVLRAEAYCLKVCCDEHDLVFYISLLHIFQNRLQEMNCFRVMGIFPYRILALHNNKFKEWYFVTKIVLTYCDLLF